MKNKFRKLLTAGLAIAMIVSSCLLTACGSGSGSGAASGNTYTAVVASTVTADDWYPEWMFFKSVIPRPYTQAGLCYTLTVELQDDDKYVLDAEIHNEDEDMEEGDASWCHIVSHAEGTYEKGDGTIELKSADYAEYSVSYGSFLEAYISPFSYGTRAGKYAGEWTSDDQATLIADIIPDTVLTVDGNTIVSIAAEGKEEEESDESDGDDLYAQLADMDSLIQIQSNGGKTYLDFYADGTYAFSYPDVQVAEAGTWTYTDGTLTLTTPNGVVFEPEMDGNVASYTFKTDKSENLGGEFEINMDDFAAAVQ